MHGIVFIFVISVIFYWMYFYTITMNISITCCTSANKHGAHYDWKTKKNGNITGKVPEIGQSEKIMNHLNEIVKYNGTC